MSFFHDIPLLPEDPILSIPIAFAADPNPKKVNLGVGSYKTAEGLPLVMTSVKKAESLLLQKNLPKEYLPIDGDPEFLNVCLQLLFGPELTNLNPKQLYTCQTVGCSAALRLAGEFVANYVSKTIFISQPSWSNHKLIFESAGLKTGSYPYFNSPKHQLDFNGMCQAIKNMPKGSAILLQAGCHNPTGTDPSFDQWKELSKLIKNQHLIPIFDMAYHGMCQDLDRDADIIRYFTKEKHEMIICYSFAKNFGLYAERVGFLCIVSYKPDITPAIGSQIKTEIRSIYSTPPAHGSRIVTTILKSPELTLEWKNELQNMRDRIKEMRTAFVAGLLARGAHEDFSYINQQRGLFSLCGLNQEQVSRLRQERGVYMPNNGRINIAGITTKNLDYVVESILSVM